MSGNQPDTERRDSVRHRCNQAVLVSPDTAPGEPTTAWRGTVTNISHNGLAMVLQRKLQTGQAVSICPIELARARSMQGQVIHVSQHHNGWFTGCQFTASLNDKELQEWLK